MLKLTLRDTAKTTPIWINSAHIICIDVGSFGGSYIYLSKKIQKAVEESPEEIALMINSMNTEAM